jgi:hypothetical protein
MNMSKGRVALTKSVLSKARYMHCHRYRRAVGTKENTFASQISQISLGTAQDSAV